MKKISSILLLVVSLLGMVLVGGCGSGGSSPVPTPTPKPGIPFDQLGTRQRLLLDTDFWFYSFAGSVNQGAGDVAITGDVEQLVDRVPVNGQSYRALSSIYNLTSSLGNGIASASQYFSQDPVTRVMTIYGIAENGQVRFYAAPQLPLLKNGGVGDSGTQTITYADGTTETISQSVVGTELITVPAGKFMTYKIMGSRKSSTRTIEFTTWYSRQLGSFVMSDDSSVFTNGQSSKRHLELTGTTVTPLE